MSNDKPLAPEIIWKTEDALREQLVSEHSAVHPLPNDGAAAAQPQPPIDLDAERAAYHDLLAFIAEHKDTDTQVTSLSIDEFMAGLDATTNGPTAPSPEESAP